MPTSGAFKKGDGRPRKPKGAVNKTTKSAREAFALAFEGCGGYTSLTAWAIANQTDFYKLYARLIPVEHVGAGGEGPISTIVRHVYESEKQA
jgi:hypothetical protein